MPRELRRQLQRRRACIFPSLWRIVIISTPAASVYDGVVARSRFASRSLFVLLLLRFRPPLLRFVCADCATTSFRSRLLAPSSDPPPHPPTPSHPPPLHASGSVLVPSATGMWPPFLSTSERASPPRSATEAASAPPPCRRCQKSPGQEAPTLHQRRLREPEPLAKPPAATAAVATRRPARDPPRRPTHLPQPSRQPRRRRPRSRQEPPSLPAGPPSPLPAPPPCLPPLAAGATETEAAAAAAAATGRVLTPALPTPVGPRRQGQMAGALTTSRSRCRCHGAVTGAAALTGAAAVSRAALV